MLHDYFSEGYHRKDVNLAILSVPGFSVLFEKSEPRIEWIFSDYTDAQPHHFEPVMRMIE